MSVNENLFKNITNPIEKLVKENGSRLVDSVENSVVGSLSAALQRVGLGDGSNKNVLGNLGEQVLAGIAGEIFGAIGREINLSSKSDIENLRGVAVDSPTAIDGFSSFENGNEQVLFFPSDLNEFYVQFNFKKYSRPAPNVPATALTEWQLALPLPRELVDRHNVQYNDKAELGFFGVVANGGQNPADNTFDTQTAAAYGGRLLIKRLTEHSGNVMGLLSQSFGASLNPHLSVMFEAPTLRTHRMQWLFAPNNEEESEKIRQIAKKLRGAALPSFIRDSAGNANFNILDYPMMCAITLYPWGDNSKFSGAAGADDKHYDGSMFTYKHCVINQVSLNYAPDAIAFFNDDKRSPAFVSLEISFLEIEYYTGDDFGRKGDKKTAEDLGRELSVDFGLIAGLPADEQAKIIGERINSYIDDGGKIGNTSAQNENIDNSSLTDVPITDKYENPNNPKQILVKSTQGGWYEITMGDSGNTVKIIDKFNDQVFTTYKVLDADATTTMGPAITDETFVLNTGTDGLITWDKP